ncbi:MAG: hypothetical protein ACJ74Z_03495 [Bryobacteraceae bacterium]|jgi:type IV secretory pathway VirB3-like protein
MQIHDPLDVTNKVAKILFIPRIPCLVSFLLSVTTYELSASMMAGLKLFVALWVITFCLTFKDPKRPQILLNALLRKPRYDAGRWNG